MTTGTLYLVSTPIGNLKDMTFRAVETLKMTPYIIAEDTRVTGKLLNHFDIQSKLISYHEHNEKSRTEEIMVLLRSGTDISMVSDAGTPLISDPGFVVVDACIREGITVQAIPGASSVLSSLILSGFDPSRFVFYGFLEKKDRAKSEELKEIEGYMMPCVILESPHRVKDTLAMIYELLPGREIAVVKELTKIHETVFRGDPEAVSLQLNEENLKGEFIIVIGPGRLSEVAVDAKVIEQELRRLIASGATKRDAVREAAGSLHISKNDVYKVSLDL
jgi:16S rRNA (cytidine1402-2'-O)-methyltransferase